MSNQRITIDTELGDITVTGVITGPTGPTGPTGAEGGTAALTTNGDILTRAAGVPARITRDDLATDLAGRAGMRSQYSAIVDVLPRAATPQEMPPDSALSVARLDIFPAELASGTQVLTTQRQATVYFQVSRDITVNTVAFCGDTTASATITTGLMGLCFIGDDGHVYPAAKSANDTAMFGSASTLTAKTFDTTSGWPSSVTLAPGRWYAATVLMDGTTMPTLVAGPAPRNAIQGNSRSRRTGVVTAFLDFQSRSNMGGLTYQTPWCSVRAGGSTNKARTCVLFGDSFLASNGYPDWIGRGNAQGGSRLHFIQNKGTSGDTLTGMISRWTTDVAAYDPEWVVIHGGTNDIHGSGATSAQVIANYETLIGLAQAAGINMLLCTPPPNTGSTAGQKTTLGTVRTWLLALSTTGVTVVDTGTALSTGDGVTADAALLADTVHPNSTTGRAALANAVGGVIAAIT